MDWFRLFLHLQGCGDSCVSSVAHLRRHVSRRTNLHVGSLSRPQHLFTCLDTFHSHWWSVCLLQHPGCNLEDSTVPLTSWHSACRDTSIGFQWPGCFTWWNFFHITGRLYLIRFTRTRVTCVLKWRANRFMFTRLYWRSAVSITVPCLASRGPKLTKSKLSTSIFYWCCEVNWHYYLHNMQSGGDQPVFLPCLLLIPQIPLHGWSGPPFWGSFRYAFHMRYSTISI